jgi:hypothetical protein
MMRIPVSLHDRLARRAEAADSTLAGALRQVLDSAEETEFWAELDRTMAKPEALGATAAELQVWQRTVRDGLDEEGEFDWGSLA